MGRDSLSSEVQGSRTFRESVSQEVLDRTTEAIFLLDREWRFTYVNAVASTQMRRPVEALLGRVFWDTVAVAGTSFEAPYREAAEHRREVTLEAYSADADRWYLIRICPTDDGLTVYSTDTTENHRRIRELAERARQQNALAMLSHRCIAAVDGSLADLLDDVAQTVASTVGARRVEILGQPVGHSAASVIAAAPQAPPAETAQPEGAAVRVPIPASSRATTDLVIHMDAGRELGTDSRDFVASVVALISNCTRQAEQAVELRGQALHDPITGLPNRRLLLSHLRDLLWTRRAETLPAVLTVAVERMNLITGSLGHQAADELYVAVAQRISRVTEPHVMLSRLSGEIFVLVVEDSVGELEPSRIAESLHAVMREPLRTSSGEHFVTLRIGIAYAAEATAPEALLRDSDAALRRAVGSRRTVVFDDRVRSEITRQAQIDRELHRAVEREEFRVHYQPIVELASGATVGVEALIRWDHPERGLVSPGDFINTAEENGLIVPIGRWVLEHAAGQVAAWQQELGRPLHVAVNVSARQLADPTFARCAADIAGDAGLMPHTLQLELTESLLMESAEMAREMLEELRSLGIRVALDDFGTGYSSLSYLTELAVDTLKVDRSFVNRLQPGKQTAVVEAIVTMAHAAGLTVIAEGVETREQEQMLTQLGCDQVQGFFYSRPLPAADIRGLLAG